MTDSLSLSALKTRSKLSTSSADNVIVNETSSSVSCGPMPTNTGASFTGVTITRTSSNAISRPSESFTIKVNVSSPYQSSTAPNVTSKSSMDTVIFSFPETVNVKASSSISPMYPEKSSTRLSSSAKVKFSGKAMVGESLTGVTVKRKLVSSLKFPLSVPVTVIVTFPLKFKAGVMVS